MCYDLSVYEGDFVENKYHGFGVFTQGNGITCFGEYRNGIRDGMICVLPTAQPPYLTCMFEL